MPHHRLITHRALRSTSAAAGALALLALPLAAPAAAMTKVSEGGLESALDADSEEAGDDLAARVLAIAERAVGDLTGSDDGAALPAAPGGDRDMEPAGGDYQPVAEPAPGPAPAAAEPAVPASTSTEAQTPAARPAVPHGANGPIVPGWSSRTTTAFEPVQAPIVAGPITVPAPQFASPESLAALASAAKDGWAAVTAPVSAGLDPHTPTQWPLAVATGMLLLVGGAHALRAYDKRWKASAVTSTE